MINIRNLLETAVDAAFGGGKAIMEIYNSGDFKPGIKHLENFPSTKADKSAHTIITTHLSKTNVPVLSEEGVRIDFDKRRSWEYFWLIDPLDGTKEFINKNGEFSINIALVQKNTPVAGVVFVPCLETMYYGSKETGVYKNVNGKLIQFAPLSQRIKFDEVVKRKQIKVVASRSHLSAETSAFINQFQNVTLRYLGSSLKFMMLLENEADIYPRLGGTMEWDTAAAHAILNATNRGVYQINLKSELTYNKVDLTNPFFIAF